MAEELGAEGLVGVRALSALTPGKLGFGSVQLTIRLDYKENAEALPYSFNSERRYREIGIYPYILPSYSPY